MLSSKNDHSDRNKAAALAVGLSLMAILLIGVGPGRAATTGTAYDNVQVLIQTGNSTFTGSYTVTANVADKAGNPAQASRALTVDEERVAEPPSRTGAPVRWCEGYPAASLMAGPADPPAPMSPAQPTRPITGEAAW